MANKSTAKSKVTKAANGVANGHAANGTETRLDIQKTYKLYIGGQFPRTESGRYFKLKDASGNVMANMCRGSRKDFRNAVKAARGAFKGWKSKTAYNRGQILYRVAEVMEGRRIQFVAELQQQGATQAAANAEVTNAIDRMVYYAGWADKYQQIFSSVNPVAASYFNFSMCEPTGVVAVMCPSDTGLIGMVSTIVPAICGGNTVVALASDQKPLCAITFAEVLNASDVPGGVVNLLTGHQDELAGHFSSHMDVNSIVYCENDKDTIKSIQENSTGNLKRVHFYRNKDWKGADGQSPYFILDQQEIKTTWHPVGV